MNKTILWIFVLIIIPISVNVISDLISEHLLNEDSEIKVDEVPEIVNKNTISVDFWLNEKGKMDFQNNQAVVVHYKIKADNEQSLFFSLFSRASSDGAWSPLLENQLVKVGELYSFSVVKVKSSQFVTQGFELHLQAGTEYFLAVVSAEPNGNSELARKELIVEVE